ncbi:hypothetical protein L1887_19770 [Cichorium endivia]|nr:hypothetical protein L1887_19770 [Cichorium endivia]
MSKCRSFELDMKDKKVKLSNRDVDDEKISSLGEDHVFPKPHMPAMEKKSSRVSSVKGVAKCLHIFFWAAIGKRNEHRSAKNTIHQIHKQALPKTR